MDTLARLILEHRRLLAAVCAGLAVLAALGSRAEDASGVTVWVASDSLSSGDVVESGDLRSATYRPGSVPEGVVADADAIVGRRVAGPMNAGEAFTSRRILDPTALDGFGRDAVLASVRIAEPDAVSTIRVGDAVDIVAVDPHGEHTARVVARAVSVVTLPAEVDDDRAATIRVATDEETALALASAAIESRFSLLLAHRD